MKKPIILMACAIFALVSNAQIGIGTTTPNSTLEVYGSVASRLKTFSASYTADVTDCNLIFTGSSATTLTLPTAASITGRMYVIKNASTNSSVLTVNTTSSQTIDGVTSQTLNNPYQVLTVVSNGSNWNIIGHGLPSGSGTDWSQGGNAVSGETNLGTTSNYALPFITNNTEKMRISNTGNVGIGQTSFNGTNPEKLYVNSGTGTNTAIYTTGNINDYLQFNIQNASNGNLASSDIVATANNGSASTVYIDMGINSQGYSNGSSNILNGSNVAYLYSTGSDFYIGNGAQNKELIFFTNTGATGADGTERVRITSTALQPGSNNSMALGGTALKWTAVYATNGTIQTSDRRLKTNILELKYGLKEILSLQPVSYNWMTNPNAENKIGLIAQDVRKIIPEVVIGDEAKENIGMNYAELVPVLVNAIKEQQQQIDQLRKKLEQVAIK